MTQYQTRPCPLCGSDATRPLFTKAGQDHVRCVTCGFHFAVAAGNANLDNAITDFEPAYREYLEPSAVDDRNHGEVVARIERFVTLDASASLLDVGAGSGKFLRHVRASRPCRADGVEPSAALFHAYRLGDLGVENVTLPQFAASGSRRYRVVTALDVIEHVTDPCEFGAALGAVVEPGGFVFLSTPDAGSILSALLGRRWHHYNRYHFSLFNRATLDRLGREAGFSTVSFGHYPKRISSSYLRAYVANFLLGSRSSVTSAGRWSIPLNLFDIMWVVWKKHAG